MRKIDRCLQISFLSHDGKSMSVPVPKDKFD